MYSEEASTCPNTCTDKEAEENCENVPPVAEGCTCDVGFVRSGRWQCRKGEMRGLKGGRWEREVRDVGQWKIGRGRLGRNESERMYKSEQFSVVRWV